MKKLVKKISGNTKTYGVLANPIKHSLSPLIHNTAFQTANMDAVYLAFEVKNNRIEEALAGVRALELSGVNISMPYKRMALDYLIENNFPVCEVSELVGSCNTIVNTGRRLRGYNTDGIGLVTSIEKEGISLAGKRLSILGAGGAARAIVCQLAKSSVQSIVIFKRHNESFQDVSAYFNLISMVLGVKIDVYPYENVKLMQEVFAQTDILINATQVGMTGYPGLPIESADMLHEKLIVVDLIYAPLETEFLKAAKTKGCRTMNGIGMLLYQAASSFKLMTGKTMPIDQVKVAIEQQLNKL
ncbi:shikimate dehydrogenase [Vagococcus penaei]|nr:shikimate dehydrogenase [Vagococcus penaei]